MQARVNMIAGYTSRVRKVGCVFTATIVREEVETICIACFRLFV